MISKPKKKKLSLPNERKKALGEFQKMRKLQEMTPNGMGTCISCGKIDFMANLQGGHYIPRANRATELEPDNVWPQCPRCNMMEGGNYVMYRDNLLNKIGPERVERIENMARAYQGSTDALYRLSEEDGRKAIHKKTATDYREILERCKAENKRYK